MAELIIQTNNFAQIGTSWKVTRTGTPRGKTASLAPVWDPNRLGVCSALTLLWMRKTHKKGAPLASLAELGDDHLHQSAIAFGAAAKNKTPALEFLKSVMNFTAVHKVPPFKNNDVVEDGGKSFYRLSSTGGFAGMVSKVAAIEGFTYVVIHNADATKRHAVGFHIDAAAGYHYFFDPGYGLFKFTDAAEVRLALPPWLEQTYPEVSDRYTYYEIAFVDEAPASLPSASPEDL